MSTALTEHKTLYQLAYETWSKSSPYCDCTDRQPHGNPLVDEKYIPVCTRAKTWWAYVKVRDGHPLTTEDLFNMGAM